MPEIYFYSGVADKLQIVCRLCAKALSQNARVMVYTPDMTLLETLDKLLWTYQPTSFLPHCFASDSRELVQATPILLSDRIDQVHDCDMLINLHTQCPAMLEKFGRVIEIASVKAEDKSLARQRYRFYQQSGYSLHHHDLGGQ